MDDWSPEQHRRHNKRTFTQMSELLQPLRNQNPFIASSPHPLPDPSTFASTSSFNMPPRVGHQQHHSNSNPPENMAHRRLPMPSLQPSLQHQSSRTIIDLTDDADFPSSQPRRSSQRSVAPPQLERSDSMSLGQDIITIDSDDDDVEITNVRQVPAAPARQHNRSQAVPALRLQRPPILPVHHHIPRHPRADGPIAWGNRTMDVIRNGPMHQLMAVMLPRDIMYNGIHGADDAPPRMPGMMDYGQHAFVRPEPRKEDFVPPPPAREGFTRSPKEDDIVVCPACDEELMVDPMEKEPGPEKKPSARKKSKADRAEHPFWVVRECGHVYCNKCYQNRKLDFKSSTRLFPLAPGPKKTMTPICAVDGCDKEVADKKHWVGVFL